MLLCLSASTHRCDVETSILRSLDLHFGTLWGPLASCGSSWASLGPPWELSGDKVDFRGIFPSEYSSILETFLAPESSKVVKKLKKTVSRKQCRKSVIPELARNGKKWILYCNYHMKREVGHHPFWWHFVSFWLPFGVTFGHFLQKVVIRELKKTRTTNTSKFNEKGGPRCFGGLLVNP